MRTDENSAALDRDEFDGDEARLFEDDGTGDEPVERIDDPDAEPDEALIEAEVGDHDIVPDDPEPCDDPDDDALDVEDDDDLELVLLQDLGIDLDAPDEHSDLIESLPEEPDATMDDEVAA